MMIKLTIHITQGPVWYLEDMQFIWLGVYFISCFLIYHFSKDF